ncbi:hypothetical protein [Fontibacillus phaseoli]|nr:hypothetical protein [Fontibacillus phaseoli]
MFLILTGCAGTPADYSNEYNPDTDYQYFLHEQGPGIRIGASKDGYYFLNNKYIYYMDKTTMKPVLLDNRPDSDCLKKEDTNPIENCNAYVAQYAGPKDFLSYYNGKLYIIASDTVTERDKQVDRAQLLELSKDGTERRKILTFEFIPQAIAIHRGVVYYTSMDFDQNSDGKYQIMQFRLGQRSAKPEVIYEGTQEKGHITDMIPYGKNVYILEWGINMYRTLRYDIQDQTVTPMYDEDDENSNEGIAGIMDQKLLFDKFYGDPLDERSWHFYESNLEGEDVRTLPIKRDFMSSVYADQKHFFARTAWYYLTPELAEGRMNPNQIDVYDLDYKLVDSIDVSFLPMDHTIITGDENNMFVHYGEDGKKIIAVLDKSQIGSGKAAFRTLIETKDEGPTLRTNP